jgi:threonyl-tRNA synthetase
MPAITLPDGSVRDYPGVVTGTTIAASIGPGLAKAALAMEVDGAMMDMSREISTDSRIRFITRKDPEALTMIRHDAAHVMAEAVQSLYPGTQVTIGPAIDGGFYYDFFRNEAFTPDDLPAIEARMRAIIAANAPFTREVWPRDTAIDFFEARGERFKAELIRDLPDAETITIYRQGDWLDLCRGPHMRATGDIGGAFKLTKVAGAYWRGDSRNPMLSRIYGTAWRDAKELEAHLHQLEEAERRDHRKLGRQMDLFHMQEEAAGSVFWHEKGWRLYRTVESYMRRRQEQFGYSEVRTPQLLDRSLWEKSGHWDNYHAHMFIAEVEDEHKILAVKPMNCPCHVQIFNHGLRSYRELPLRMAEFGACHRYEPSGALHGIMRVRAFAQDDAHIFCTEDQIADETVRFVDMLRLVYADFGFADFTVKFADRPTPRAGSDAVWDKAESALKSACAQAGVSYTLNPGEGAFYGPKLEFVLRDAIGRDWQCGTLQVDFVMPERLDATYITATSTRAHPVMLHRAIVGSFERFIGILIESFAGRFPLWLAPTQVAVASIVTDANDYAETVATTLKAAGLSVVTDTRNEKINAKIRDLSLALIPNILVVGRREAEQNTVSLRRLGNDASESMPLDDLVATLSAEATPPDLRRGP